MINLNKKIAVAVATAAIVLGAVAPAAFASTTNVTVSGNGALSSTGVKVNNTTNTTVVQSNASNVVTVVNSTANTGGNHASFNTGGATVIGTGNATSNVNVTVGGSSNKATVPTPAADNTTNVTVSGNGALSVNKVKVTNTNVLTVVQQNLSNIWTVLASSTKTGNNSSNFNTGGTTGIGTGDATSNVTVNVTGSSNTL